MSTPGHHENDQRGFAAKEKPMNYDGLSRVDSRVKRRAKLRLMHVVSAQRRDKFLQLFRS